MAQKAKKKRSDEDIRKLEIYNVNGLEELIIQIKNLKENNTYKNLYDSFNLRGKIIAPKTNVKTLRAQSPLIKTAKNQLSNSSFSIPYNNDLIDYKMFCVMYTFLESIYYLNLGRKIGNSDFKNLYSNNLDKRIIFALDKFNETYDNSKQMESFFLKLKKIKWSDKETKKFFEDLHDVMVSVGAEIFGYSLNRFRVTENGFILFLSGCSALKDAKDNLSQEDVVRAYRTYFKLMKTDISKLVDDGIVNSEFEESNGYLVCNACGGYYKLQPGESPDDFEDNCECGGHLRFVNSLEDIN